ncbi:hypothetical protein CDAR_315291 [Caerostris darwini]|uniref:Uncharacterized protein n=1 Tax=Caerostris darwini TaxID=1538125 RepID=A0AAV4QR20_9ARAC|nr:hypothetical protein CDAR_315291 [Caerostris darwini]
MAEDQEMKFLVYQLIPNVMIEAGSIETKQPLDIESFGNITREIIIHLTHAVVIKMHFNGETWKNFIIEKGNDFFNTEERYLSCVLYAAHVVNSRTQGIYERFIEVIATVLAIAHLMYDSNIQILEYSPQILTAFFDSVLKKLFYKRGGWKHLVKHIKSQNYMNCFEQIDNLAPQPDNRTMQNAFEGILESFKQNFLYEPVVVTSEEVQNHALTAELVKKVMEAHEKDPSLPKCIFPNKEYDYIWISNIANSTGKEALVLFTEDLEMKFVPGNYIRGKPLGSTENQQDFDCVIREDSEHLRLPEKCLLNKDSDNDIERCILDVVDDIGYRFSSVKTLLDSLMI